MKIYNVKASIIFYRIISTTDSLLLLLCVVCFTFLVSQPCDCMFIAYALCVSTQCLVIVKIINSRRGYLQGCEQCDDFVVIRIRCGYVIRIR